MLKDANDFVLCVFAVTLGIAAVYSIWKEDAATATAVITGILGYMAPKTESKNVSGAVQTPQSGQN